jgi:hypothetical protein
MEEERVVVVQSGLQRAGLVAGTYVKERLETTPAMCSLLLLSFPSLTCCWHWFARISAILDENLKTVQGLANLSSRRKFYPILEEPGCHLKIIVVSFILQYGLSSSH